MMKPYNRAMKLTLLAGCLCPAAMVDLCGLIVGYPRFSIVSLALFAALAVVLAIALWGWGGARGKGFAIASVAAAMAPVVLIRFGSLLTLSGETPFLETGLVLAAGLALYGVFDALLRRAGPALDAMAEAQVRWVDNLPPARVLPAVVVSAALSLFLELAVIRWHTTLLELFAFYKNFSLLACFAGLGLGYALSAAATIPLATVLPLLAWQFALMLFMAHGLPDQMLQRLMLSPITEQLNMGWAGGRDSANFIGVYLMLAMSFATTALPFIPVGQLCGRLMTRGPRLPAYGANLLGSALGAALMLGAGFLWTPPAIWFAACFLALFLFQGFEARASLLAGVAALAGLAALSWPVSFTVERIYSPYQLIERGQAENGLMQIRAAGHFYQEVYDLSLSNRNRVDHEVAVLAARYEAPYFAFPKPKKVAVVGAGTGNDVAAALRLGAERVDAIEIDPAIQQLGVAYHPERPYDDPRVRRVVNDARSHFRTCGEKYDLIVYGLLDSHSLLGHTSNVRLDSFVYTVEGLREAAACLNDGGGISLSFLVLSPELGRKIQLMMATAFDGKPPLCLATGSEGTIMFLAAKGRDLAAEGGSPDPSLKPYHAFEDPAINAELPTDDWPFFYMPRRVYPFSYVVALGLIAALSTALIGNFVAVRPRFDNASFFFMGAGFMLVETKGITELGLAFGNTWQVVGIVIIGILAMAFLANAVAHFRKTVDPGPAFILLLASLVLGAAISHFGGFPPTAIGRIATLAVLTCPIFFAGLAFSTLLAKADDVPGAMAINLLGALLGGLIEYNSMYFGFRSLYWMAAALYVAALLASRRRAKAA